MLLREWREIKFNSPVTYSVLYATVDCDGDVYTKHSRTIFSNVSLRKMICQMLLADSRSDRSLLNQSVNKVHLENNSRQRGGQSPQSHNPASELPSAEGSATVETHLLRRKALVLLV